MNDRPADSPTSTRRCRSLRRRRLKILLQLMGRADRPERVATAVALGVAVGFSPFIGFHFFLAIALATLFRLNRFDAVIGSFAGNPWTLPPIYAAGYRLGRAILGYAPARVPPLRWQRILHHDFWVAFRGPGFGPRLSSFMLGTTILAALLALGAYIAALGILRLYHRRHPRVAERAARRRGTTGVSIRPEADEPPPADRVH